MLEDTQPDFEDDDRPQGPTTTLPLVRDAWGICWRGSGRPYVMRTWEEREEADVAFVDLMLPYDPTSPWWSLLGVMPCESDPDRPGGRGKNKHED